MRKPISSQILCRTVALFAGVALTLFLSFSTYAEVSDFSKDIGQAEKAASANNTDVETRSGLSDAEYISSWDEFGSSPVIDGTESSADITAAISDDISSTVSAEQHFDNTEIGYLEATGATPEQIVAAENKTGSDVPPGETLDPNPSLAENPDANATVAEDISPETIASAGVEPSVPASTEGGSVDTGASSEQAVFEAVVTGDPEYIGANEQNASTGTTDSGSEAAPTDQNDSSVMNFHGPDAPTGADAASDNSSVSGSSPGTGSGDTTSIGGSSDSSSSDTGGADSSSSDGGDSGGADSGGGAGDSSSANVATAFANMAPALQHFFQQFFMMFKIHL